MLTDVKLRSSKPTERTYTLADGKGLVFLVQPNGSRMWRYRYRFQGVAKMISFGIYPETDLATARSLREAARSTLRGGKDPSLVRKAEKAALAESQANSFEAVALEWHEKASKSLTPTNSKWIYRRLETNIFRRIGQFPIADIRPPQVLAVVRAIEKQGKLETAHRVLSICSKVFRYAVASGRIESDPTRDLRGALTKVQGGHFGALTSPEDVAGLLRAVDSYKGSPETRAALLFGILTFVRPGNLREAEWDEFFDLGNPTKAEWRIPGTKMKVRTDRPFVVPLAPQAIAVVEGLRPLTSQSKYLFPSTRTPIRPMSNNAVLAALRRMGYTSEEMTGHGVRAMARTLCHEVLGFAPEVIEEQLAHGKVGPLGGAYDRTTHMPERRRLMREWAAYLDRLKTESIATSVSVRSAGTVSAERVMAPVRRSRLSAHA